VEKVEGDVGTVVVTVVLNVFAGFSRCEVPRIRGWGDGSVKTQIRLYNWSAKHHLSHEGLGLTVLVLSFDGLRYPGRLTVGSPDFELLGY